MRQLRRREQNLAARHRLKRAAAVLPRVVEQRRLNQQARQTRHLLRIRSQLDGRPARQQVDRTPVVKLILVAHLQDRSAIRLARVHAHRNLGHAGAAVAARALVHLHLKRTTVVRPRQQAEDAHALEAVSNVTKRPVMRIAGRTTHGAMPVRTVAVRTVAVRAVTMRRRRERRRRRSRWRRRGIALARLDHRRDTAHVARALGWNAERAEQARRRRRRWRPVWRRRRRRRRPWCWRRRRRWWWRR